MLKQITCKGKQQIREREREKIEQIKTGQLISRQHPHFCCFSFSFLSYIFCSHMAFVSHLQLWFVCFFFFFMVLVSHSSFFFPFRLLFKTSLSWWLKKPSWRLTPTKWVVPQYFSCPLCIHHDGSLNHYNKETEQNWTLIGYPNTHTLSLIHLFSTGLVHAPFSLYEVLLFSFKSFFLYVIIIKLSPNRCTYCDFWLSLSVQGCVATCSVHLPGPDHLWLEREWALSTTGARTRGTLLWGWTHTEVTCTSTPTT